MDFKFDLQLFADESPETISGKKLVYLFRVAEDSKIENAGALAFVTENERTTSKDADSTQTKDEIVKRMANEKAKWEKEYKKKAEHERKEQERLSKLSEDERREAEWKQKNADLEAREEALKLKEQQAEAVSVLNSRGIPVAFMPFLVTGTDNDKNMENITTFERELKKLVDAQVKEKLKGKTPNAGNSNNIEKEVSLISSKKIR